MRGRIEHGFQQASNGRNLARSEAVYQLMNLLFFLSNIGWHAGAMTSVHSTAVALLFGCVLELALKGDTLEVRAVRQLFGPVNVAAGFYRYDISADGQRILMAVPPAQGASEPVTLVQNWASGLKK